MTRLTSAQVVSRLCAVCWLTVACLQGCITQPEIDDALSAYCEQSNQRLACTSDADCCPGFVCVSFCRKRVEGQCLDGASGLQSVEAQGPCGCNADCRNNQCQSGKCL